MQQPQYPHPSPHPHMLHAQQKQRAPPAFTPHMPLTLFSHPHGPYDSAPPPSPPPSYPELQKRIDKLVEYAAKNGPEFEAMIRDKQQDNPDYSFLFGGEGHNYCLYELWMAIRPPTGPFKPSFPSSSIAMMHPPNPIMSPSPLNAPQLSGPNTAVPAGMMGGPHLHPPPFSSLYEQQHPQAFGHNRPDYDQSYRSFRGFSRPLPSDVEIELSNILNISLVPKNR